MSLKVESSTLIRAVVPPHPEGFAHVKVQNPGTPESVLYYGFNYLEVGQPFPLQIQLLSDGTPMLSWESIAYRKYQVWVTGDLTKTDWTLLETVDSYSSYTAFLHPEAAKEGMLFYRVVEIIP